MRSPLSVNLNGVRCMFSQISGGVRLWSSSAQNQPQQTALSEDDEFPVLSFVSAKQEQRKRVKRERTPVPPPRYKKMPTNVDWPSVWPVARTFHPASVPLPVHQGYVPNNKSVPGKFANLELMKIPNFLHLTPPAIQRHCEVLKRFCTPWPEELQDGETIDAFFPMQVTTTDYCHSSPTIRDKRARVVTVKFKLSNLELDEHARDKFLRLVLDRYDPKTDIVTIVTDCCPSRQQNFDYAMYLITALYHESLNVEDWEATKQEDDMEKYVWNNSKSHHAIAEWLKARINLKDDSLPAYAKDLDSESVKEDKIATISVVKSYADATTKLLNEGENKETLENYGKSVRALFGLPPDPAHTK